MKQRAATTGKIEIVRRQEDTASDPTTRHQSLSPDIVELLPRFADEYHAYVEEVLRPTQLRLKEILGQWQQENCWNKLVDDRTTPVPSPVQAFRARIKDARNVVRKVMAHPDSYPDGIGRKSFETMCDTLGVRVIVYFLSGLPVIDREIRESGIFEISEEKPPHAYLPDATYEHLKLQMPHEAKPSGYASVHYVLRFNKDVAPRGPRPWFELQLRTLTQDVWAEIEHILGYKHKTSSPQVRGQFRLIARMFGTIDEHFEMVRSELALRQSRGHYEDQEPLGADNFPGILAERGLTCSQYDLKGLLKMAASCDVITVRDLRQVMTSDNIDTVCEVCLEGTGKKPVGSELIVSLLLLFGRRQVIDRQDLLKKWSRLQSLWQQV